MLDYALILTANYAGKQWTLTGNSYDGLQWNDATPKPTQAELDALWTATSAKVLTPEQIQANKASALAKLTALGLTQDEVKALLGA
jgi:hypothetical protein